MSAPDADAQAERKGPVAYGFKYRQEAVNFMERLLDDGVAFQFAPHGRWFRITVQNPSVAVSNAAMGYGAYV